MALIKCPDCGREISEYADKCISCGCPMDKIKEILGRNKKPITTSTSSEDFSHSELYKTLNYREKPVVDELCSFVLDNTSLLKSDHPKNFGFRKKGHSKMSIMFKRSRGIVYIHFRVQSKNLTASKFRVVPHNMNVIKESILAVFPLKGKQGSTSTKKPADPTPSSERPDSFTSTRKDYENYLISTFDQKIKLKIDGVFSRNYPYMFIFKIPKGEENLTLCWFANGDNDKLAFKYYLRPLERESQKTLYPVSKDVDALVETIYKMYLSLGLKAKPMPEYIEEEEEDVEDIHPTKVPLIYNCIIKAIGDKPYSCSEEMKTACEEVKAFVLTETMHKGIEQKYFKSEEEFNTYKYSYRFVPNFFGHTFSMRNITPNDAKVFFSFYKAIKLVGLIKKYENIYNRIIVHDYSAVLHELQEMIISDDEVRYSSAKGLTSSFNLVPIETLDDCLEKLNSLESIY